jgi:drug/metabolite transporter (DMT)-like permease
MIKSDSRSKYLIGILWFIASLLVCETNDVVMKYLNGNLSPMQTVFGRFLFGTLVLLPFALKNGIASLKSKCVGANLSRGLLLFSGMLIWCYGLKFAKLNVACLLNFTTPMFTLLLASIFLKEKIGYARMFITLFGFIGVSIVLQPSGEDFNLFGSMLFLVSALFFAGLDILNKKLLTLESTLCTLFYTSFFTALFAIIPAIYSWQPISSSKDILLLVWLGVGANLLLFCILKAFEKIDVSATAPFRYVELILASLFGYIFFGETISFNTILGAIIIIPSLIFLVKKEIQE